MSKLTEFKRNAPRGCTHILPISGKDKKVHCCYDRILVKDDHHYLYAWGDNKWNYCGPIDKKALKHRIKL